MKNLKHFLSTSKKAKRFYLLFMMFVFAAGFIWMPSSKTEEPVKQFVPFGLFSDPKYSLLEIGALLTILGIAIAGLLYALLLVKQVRSADNGTPRMQAIASAVREGANAYLSAQFKKIGPLIIIITVLLFITYQGSESAFRWGRSGAFLMGSIFSWLVGFVGMRLATIGNLKVASAAKKSYGEAMQLGYRTGTITGMLTDGLGLLGGTTIFLIFGDLAYEALLGFGFGGTLLALFMRVGGGIYTKAADVGADLVGKIEKDIPEDDPRNAATIADNVGDNVGDCAGMAADIFESYEVTIVAAMILGMSTFGHKGVIFPLLVRGIGVLGSIISTYTVKAGPNDTSDTALKSVHRGFWIGSIISVVGFFLLGFGYLHFDISYFGAEKLAEFEKFGYWAVNPNHLPWFANFGIEGLDLRPAITCLIGVFLAVSLNKVTSYYTHTTHAPVKSLAKACTTGHATNIIQGFAVGYESTVAMIIVIAIAIFLSVLTYVGTPPLFIAYGVAMTGIGMLTLTGNTISMDVFGPVADNANGIGEMGYDKEEMEKEKPGSYKNARQILADLDAVGNTTKAETKGIAIGSAVIAAVSLFASFIAVIAVGSEDKINQMSIPQYLSEAGKLTVANPVVLIGVLIGGAVPFLFSSMLIRAVGRAAYYIVHECRIQFRDKEIWAGTKKPNYGRVVNICTQTAQKELIGPGFLAIMTPMLVGFLLGPYALGGFLAGMILVGQLLAVFMANAGGAWDNAKKMIEDGHYGGKGSEAHKAAVTGDTVGDPLKDTAGPAINPLIKVMNMVSLLTLGLILHFGITSPKNDSLFIGIIAVIIFIVAIGWAIWQSKRETNEHEEIPAQ
ncbi:sodium-translocating pyrophosphatase [Melioribacteraceae bacterium 09-Me]|jgi:K(+)-stimulated pyrophosphate-energized sodium pump|uniref:K(+)-insensitive pyrophosphate-energized proton pump n=2 Tax=Stygiobacter electus TaxID=3032292 RepID=A0AAE3TF45_9BACT|nr:sodium-translocating pyrophosphatase [Stygiobacter electus]MDF1613052.1 sodium-translocating pyrophosphatase [Stygiobacter electus]